VTGSDCVTWTGFETWLDRIACSHDPEPDD
jgi:hypothetical protein